MEIQWGRRRCTQAARKDAVLLPPDFSDTGLTILRRTDVPLARFQVMGERSSGTNFAKRVLGRNTPFRPTEALGWKHGFAQMTAIPADTIIVCTVRNAADWVRSMHAKPWHTTPAMQQMPFSDFLRAEWDTIVDRDRYFDAAGPLDLTGQPLQHDRHPLTGARFSDIFALRQAKLAYLESFTERGCNLVFARMEDLTADPETFVDRVRAAFDLPAREGAFRGIARRLGSKFKSAVTDRPETPATLTDSDRAYLRERIDPEQEKRLGYSY